MNGKQAKRLRRAAMGLAVTLTDAGRSIKKDGYVVKEHSSQLSASSIFDPKGVMPTPDEVANVAPARQLFVRADSVKGIYKTLKTGKA